jgi:hypothetical protein
MIAITRPLLFTAIMALASCVTQKEDPNICQTAVKYSGHKLEITGVELTNLHFKLASAAWGDVALQQAQTLTQALDVLQFGDCQSAKLLPVDDSNRSKLFEGQKDVQKALIAQATAFQNAATPKQADDALTAAKAQVDKLTAAGSPIAN